MEETIESLIDDTTFFMIDIDGVCIDTEQRMGKIAKQIGWEKALQETDWERHIQESSSVNHSLEILKEVQYQTTRINLLTRNHSAIEEEKKIQFLRNQGIILPIISVPENFKKSDIIPPSFYQGNVVLVDDQLQNVLDWKEHGGKAILFCEQKREENFPQITNLEFLKKIR